MRSQNKTLKVIGVRISQKYTNIILNNIYYNIYQNINFTLKTGEVYYYQNINLPFEIFDFIQKHGFILAGGAIETIMRGATPADYDLYCPVGFNIDIFDKIRNSGYMYFMENKYCMSFTIKTYKIQIVKRLYTYINNIISSFDIDPCRFYAIIDGIDIKVYGTTNAITSFETKIIYINFAHESVNFKRRLQKYMVKGYDIYSMNGILNLDTNKNNIYSAYISDYEAVGTNADKRNKTRNILQNLVFMFKFLPDYLYIKQNIIYDKEDFYKVFKEFEKYNEETHKKKIYLERYLPSEGIYKEPYINKIIEEGYKEYANIRNNIITQNIKNFHNVQYPKYYYMNKYKEINIFKYIPWLCGLLYNLKYKYKFNKYIIMKIMFYYAEYMIIEKLPISTYKYIWDEDTDDYIDF